VKNVPKLFSRLTISSTSLKPARLTKKQRHFVRALINPEIDTVAEAARIAGYADIQSGYRSLKKPNVQSAIKEFSDLLDDHGATDHVLAQRIAEGLHAMKTIAIGTKLAPDYNHRYKYVELVCKIRGYLSGYDTVVNPPYDPKTVQIVFGDPNKPDSWKDISLLRAPKTLDSVASSATPNGH